MALASKLLKSFVKSAFGTYINPAMGALSALGSIYSARKRDRSSAIFHQRMQDMESYGIHPLAAIGGSGMSGLGQGSVQTSDMVGGAAQQVKEKLEQRRIENRIDRHRREDKRHDLELVAQRAAANQNHGGNFFNHTPIQSWYDYQPVNYVTRQLGDFISNKFVPFRS